MAMLLNHILLLLMMVTSAKFIDFLENSMSLEMSSKNQQY